MPKNRKILPSHKGTDKKLPDIQKGLVFNTSVVIEIAYELILTHNENRPPILSKVLGHTVDSVTFNR